MNPVSFKVRKAFLALFFLGLCPRILLGGPPSPISALILGSHEQIGQTTIYDPSYVKLKYPWGDLPLERGVCADVIIRAFRKTGADLQALVHRDMRRHFSVYPKLWGLKGPDANIDHRRVPNLMTFFQRMGKELAISSKSEAYLPGDVVAFRLPNGLYHIGLVVETRSADGARPLLVHNIGAGAQIEDILFAFTIIGHYRYF